MIDRVRRERSIEDGDRGKAVGDQPVGSLELHVKGMHINCLLAVFYKNRIRHIVNEDIKLGVEMGERCLNVIKIHCVKFSNQ